jgi:hypothetical protein
LRARISRYWINSSQTTTVIGVEESSARRYARDGRADHNGPGPGFEQACGETNDIVTKQFHVTDSERTDPGAAGCHCHFGVTEGPKRDLGSRQQPAGKLEA